MIVRNLILFIGLSCAISYSYGQKLVEVSFVSDINKRTYGQVLIRLDKNLGVSFGELFLDANDFKNLFSVFVGDRVGLSPAITGSYFVADSHLVFQPKYPPPPGITYTASFNGAYFNTLIGKELLREKYAETLQFPENPVNTTTKIKGIYPNIDKVPSNLLKIYLYFSAPMGLENPYQFLSLEDGFGNSIQEPFVVIPEGLWDPERKRLTILIHPGRVKRGVGPNLVMGSVLQEGNDYTLRVDKNWSDWNGAKLQSSFEYSFSVGASDRNKININTWKLSLPEASSKDTLAIAFGESLDPALALRMVSVIDPLGNPVQGNISVDNASSYWYLLPKSAWIKGAYQLKINKDLEDLAGNTLGGVFDRVVLGDGREEVVKDNYQYLKFKL